MVADKIINRIPESVISASFLRSGKPLGYHGSIFEPKIEQDRQGEK